MEKVQGTREDRHIYGETLLKTIEGHKKKEMHNSTSIHPFSALAFPAVRVAGVFEA